jgi:hypothetical protein
MDTFNKAQHKHIGIGGINCPCCNNMARKGHDKKDRELSRMARAQVKAETRRLFEEELIIKEEIEFIQEVEAMEFLAVLEQMELDDCFMQ